MSHTNFLQLPFLFSPEALLQDLHHCLSQPWSPHFHQENYSGEWSSISLRSASGNSGDILSHAGQTFQNTALLQHTPYFSYILDCFKCPLEGVRLLQLKSGSTIKPHKDIAASYEEGNLRIHVPVITHPDVLFLLDGEKLPMQAGECWYANFNLTHEVINNSPVDRVHLVIDALRNEWTDELFEKEGFPVPPLPGQLDNTTKLQVIAELERQQNPALQELINQLKAEIGL
ncbi:aspartyl/asparaginyl beta-hydroxylase domain-containing protein [Chitinophaga sp. sic0106]|uniref:aspartyl/asparaginyl beta-hydroxylase domain-containing protein n=1 Tax=Chitinophaga sp. sic0106 TaxID=2854785 RepID=UPI001C47EFE3|nr:aspartyl/asparaginyl beta-hydroxylase domain-containing protein [Chitinophaga sp. sic0106]MBV7530605.1 aspartyl/asparaginyl beta-hydroxylase domain-containing protein [Chitinophaga sp. sic0106]